MSAFSGFFNTTVGRKYLMGLTGLFWSGFVLVHLAGNLSLVLDSSGVAFNKYAHFLMSTGELMYVAELLMIVVLLTHAWQGFKMGWITNPSARSTTYVQLNSAGGPSKKSFFSMNMKITGPLILIFLVAHLMHFKYGAHYTTVIDGVEMRDLYKTVAEVYAQPALALFYVVIMAVLGGHLIHGFWSGFQSLGLNNNRFMPLIQIVGVLVSALVTVGFIFIPLFMLYQSL